MTFKLYSNDWPLFNLRNDNAIKCVSETFNPRLKMLFDWSKLSKPIGSIAIFGLSREAVSNWDVLYILMANFFIINYWYNFYTSKIKINIPFLYPKATNPYCLDDTANFNLNWFLISKCSFEFWFELKIFNLTCSLKYSFLKLFFFC